MRLPKRSASRSLRRIVGGRAQLLWQHHGRHRADHRFWRHEIGAPAIGEMPRAVPGEPVVVLPHGIDAELAHERDRGWRRQVRRRIARSRHVELGVETAVEAPGDHRPMERRLPRGRRPENAAAARHPEPLVQVADVPVNAERGDVERDGAGRVGAVGEHRHAALVAGVRRSPPAAARARSRR